MRNSGLAALPNPGRLFLRPEECGIEIKKLTFPCGDEAVARRGSSETRSAQVRSSNATALYNASGTPSCSWLRWTIHRRQSGAIAMFRCWATCGIEFFFAATFAEVSARRFPLGGKAQEMGQLALEYGSHFFEWVHRRADLGRLSATVLLTKVYLAGRPVLLSTIRDVTAQKAAENALRENEQIFRTLFNCTPMGVAIFDEEGRVMAVNDFLMEMHQVAEGDRSQHASVLYDDPLLDAESRRKIRAGEGVERAVERFHPSANPACVAPPKGVT